jgi:hypothetical protein
VVEAEALARWHHDVGQRWSWFITEMRRQLDTDVQFFKTWEPQRRGALHAHAMVRAAGVTDRRFKQAVRECATRWGFGTQFRADPVDLTNGLHVARAAGYCAKYCAKSSDALPEVVRVSPDGEMRVGGLRAWSASRRWGDTMKSIEARRQAWARGQVSAASEPRDEADAGGGPWPAEPALDLNGKLYATGHAGVSIFRSSGGLTAM